MSERAHTKGRDRPILFSAPMVRALLDGRKTQTRRTLKPQPNGESVASGAYQSQINGLVRPSPIRFAAGDRLWVREAFQEFLASEFPPGRAFGPRGEFGIPAERAKGNVSYVAYRADGEFPPHPEDGKAVWHSPIFMPRKFSRLSLNVTEVRVQRLHDISEEDAFAEGVATFAEGRMMRSISDAEIYRLLWEEINGAGSWDANPWVAAYTFTVEHRNIDAPTPEIAP